MNSNHVLNFKYCLINAFYFMLICGAVGYANNFLLYKGFETSVIGITLTLVSLSALIIQAVMAPIIDRSTKINERKFMLFTLVIAAVLFGLLIFLQPSWLFLVVSIVAFSMCSAGVPFLNSLAFAYEQEGGKINYGVGRGIGSAAYAVGGAVIGWLVSWQGGQDEAIVTILPYFVIVMSVLSVISLLLMKDPKKVTSENVEVKQISYVEFFKKYKKIMLVIVAMIMIFFCHMLINTYMINVLQDIGGNTTDQGNAIFLQAMVELPPMFLFALILKKLKVNTLMAASAVLYIVKHAMICFAPNLPVFYMAMILQMVTYAVLMPASVYFANEYIEEQDRNKGQTVVAAAGTIGGLLSSFFGGFLLQMTGVKTVLLIGFVVTVIGAGLMLLGIRVLEKSK